MDMAHWIFTNSLHYILIQYIYYISVMDFWICNEPYACAFIANLHLLYVHNSIKNNNNSSSNNNIIIINNDKLKNILPTRCITPVMIDAIVTVAALPCWNCSSNSTSKIPTENTNPSVINPIKNADATTTHPYMPSFCSFFVVCFFSAAIFLAGISSNPC